MASTTATPMRRPAWGWWAIDAGTWPQTPTPRRYSTTRKSDPMTSWSSQKAYGFGARSKWGESPARAVYSRFMSWAPGAILPNGGRRTTSGVSPIQTR